MISLVAIITIFVACSIGATVGFGGGVIIKPVLDSMNFCTIDVVNFISSCAVLSMSTSSLISSKIKKVKIDYKIALLLSLGAVVGGFLGNALFTLAKNNILNDTLKSIQGILIIMFVGLALLYVNQKSPNTHRIKNPFAMILTGVALGTMNSFLGIGGGPINITVLLLLFSIMMKDNAIYSLTIVFFCQLSHLITLFISNQFEPYKNYISLVALAIVSAIIGGIFGEFLNKKLNEKTIKILFDLVMIFVFGINVYNIFAGII